MQSELLVEFTGANILTNIGTQTLGDENASMEKMADMLAQALSPQNRIPPDLKIDDRDIPEAPNFYEFCMDPDGMDQAPFAKQLALFTHLFAEWCPPCTHEMFHDIRDFPVDYPVKEAKEHVTFLEYGVCPNCHRTKSEMINDGTLKGYFELALVAGQRSGKSIGISLANCYLIHKYLKLQNPAKVFSLTKNTSLAMTFVGLTFAKAKELLYNPVLDLIGSSAWFTAYMEMIKHYEEKFSEEIGIVGKEMIAFKHRQLVIHPANPNKRILRGATRALAEVDELGWFPFGDDSDSRERAGADEVYKSLDRSLLTLREEVNNLIAQGYNNIPGAYGLYLSSPSAYNDKIMSLARSFEGSDSSLALNLPTWEMNPKIKRNSAVIKKAYREDPVKAERDFGANPPLSDSPFISDVTEFLTRFKKKPNILRHYRYVTNKRGRRYAKFDKLEGIQGPCVLAIDAGEKYNSFAVTVGKLNEFDRPIIVGMGEIAPSHGKPLDYSYLFRHFLMPIIEKCGVVGLLVDRWQSTKIMHDVEYETSQDGKFPCEAKQYSLRKSDFDMCIDYMSDPASAPQFPRLECPYEEIVNKDADKYPHSFKNQPAAHLLFQMATVRETARAVLKGEGYTDDIFRSLMLLLTHLYDEDYVEWVKTKDPKNTVSKSKAVFAGQLMSSSSGYSGGSIALPFAVSGSLSNR